VLFNSIQPPRKLAVRIGPMAQSSHLGPVHLLGGGAVIRQPKRKGHMVVEKRRRKVSRAETCNEGSPPPAPISLSKPVRYTGPLRLTFSSTPRSKLPPVATDAILIPGPRDPHVGHHPRISLVCFFPSQNIRSSYRAGHSVRGNIFQVDFFACAWFLSRNFLASSVHPPHGD